MPWDVDRLTSDELEEYLRQYAQYARDQRTEAARQRRR